jgi:hypothetical protein
MVISGVCHDILSWIAKRNRPRFFRTVVNFPTNRILNKEIKMSNMLTETIRQVTYL